MLEDGTMKLVTALLFAFCSLVFARTAFAEEQEEHVHEKSSLVEAFAEAGVGVRTFDLSGMTLMTAGVSQNKSRMSIKGEEVSIFALPMINLGVGLRIGPAVAGVEIGGGVGGGASAPARMSGDIQVRPSGFAAAMTAATFLGVMYEKRHYRLRLDGVLGSELVGIGMERPGYDDTSVSAINQTRWTLGPRARFDFLTAGGPGIGITLGCDARNPANVMLGIVMTTL